MTIRPDLPDLSDEQVDRMYRRITATLTRDAAVRRATRRRIVLAAASVVAVLGLGGVVVAGVQTNSGDDAGGDSSVSLTEGASSAEQPNAAQDEAGTGADADGGAGSGGGTAGEPGVREVVTTASASVEVDDAGAAADTLSRWVEAAGGRVETRSESADDDTASVSIRLRVPAARAGDTTDRLRELGTVSDLRIDSADVTAQGRDLDARIRALQASVARLQQFVTDAPTTAALLAAEETLSQRQSALEALQAERRGLSDQVAMATYDLELTEPRAAEEPDGAGFVGGLTAGWNGLVATLDVTVLIVGLVLPWAAVLAVLAGAYVVGRRLLRA